MAKSKTPIVISIDGEKSIEDVASLKEQLMDAIKKSQEVTLDMSKAEDIDTSIIQLILSTQKEAENQKVKFSLSKDIPMPIIEMFNLLNLSLPVNSVEV